MNSAKQIRMANPDDAEAIYAMVLDLARHQRSDAKVHATAELFRQQLGSDNALFECLICEVDGKSAGFAMFYTTYSSWEGRGCLYLEDLFVYVRYRKLGIGRELLQQLMDIATNRNYARVEWSCLRDNDIAMRFYENLGAQEQPAWTRWRLEAAQGR